MLLLRGRLLLANLPLCLLLLLLPLARWLLLLLLLLPLTRWLLLLRWWLGLRLLGKSAMHAAFACMRGFQHGLSKPICVSAHVK